MRHERGPGAALDELFDDLGAEGRAVVGAAASYQGCPGNTLGRYRTVRCDDGAMDQRISLVTLGVNNLPRARAFYEALGWGGAEQPDDEVCFFQAGGMVFGLWTALGGHGAPGIELAYNVRSPAEVGEILAEAQRAGGTVVRQAAIAAWGGTTGAFADPDGYVWEVAHNPGWTLSDDGSVHI
jgi:catechol 2,3-dioxygenase-like lactoylglutathione lyase family enzyme